MKDKLFIKPFNKQFEFNKDVASVFNDMANRSIPFYREVQNLIISLIESQTTHKKKEILDLGCSTGNFLFKMAQLKNNYKLIGIDNSISMLEIAKKEAKLNNFDISFRLENILDFDYFSVKPNFIISNYTFQFINPSCRKNILLKIFNSLELGGMFILSEKIIFKNDKLNEDIINIYFDYKKKNNYNDYEIKQKKEALNNILIPWTIEENIQLCRDSGFKIVDTIFQWGNFITIIAKKMTI